MVDAEANQNASRANFDHLFHGVGTKTELGSDENVKSHNSFSRCWSSPGACPGCGETPYAKLVTQLFGDEGCLSQTLRDVRQYGDFRHHHHRTP